MAQQNNVLKSAGQRHPSCNWRDEFESTIKTLRLLDARFARSIPEFACHPKAIDTIIIYRGAFYFSHGKPHSYANEGRGIDSAPSPLSDVFWMRFSNRKQQQFRMN